MSQYQALFNLIWNHAPLRVHMTKTRRVFILLVFLLSLVGGSRISVQAALINLSGFNPNSERYPYTIDEMPDSGHLRVTVSPDKALAEYIRSVTNPGDNGVVSHTYTIDPESGETTYVLTTAIDLSEGGTIDPAVGSKSYPEEEVVSITATAAGGYEFDQWTGDVADPDSASTTVAMEGNKTVTAHFVEVVAHPLINSINFTPNPVGRYEKFELTIDLTARYTNPFDPDDIDLWVIFTSPSSENWNVKGFWDGTQWKIRFAANEIGIWNFIVYVDDQTGQSSSDFESFTVTSSSNHGWLRVSSSDPHFFIHDDGSSFYGIGQCRPWNLNEVPNIFSDMQSHGMNTLVYWIPHWDNMLVTMATGYDHYDMDHAANLDNVVEDAEEHDIYLMLTIWNHDEIRGDGHPWGRTNFEEYNPFSSLSDADGFMSDPTSWSYQEKLYRYIIARWGYSRAIGQWHTVCEIDGTTNSYNNDAATDPWHNKINNYYKNNDPFSHPTTASKAGDNWWPNGYTAMDIPQIHSYAEASDAVAVADKLAYWTRRMWNDYDKPNVIGEFGTSSEGLQPMHLHNGIWASFGSGAAITALDWNDGNTFGDFSADMYDHASYLADFISDIQFDQLGLSPSSLSIDPEFKAWGMNGSDSGYLWAQDTSPGESNTGTSLTISGLTNGVWDLNWYNTWTGTYYAGPVTVSTSGNSITTTVPDFTNDIACRITLNDSATTYDLTMAVYPAEGGTTDPVVGVHNYPENEVVTITATPATGNVFDHWSGACTGSGTCQVTMDAAKTVTATFTMYMHDYYFPLLFK